MGRRAQRRRQYDEYIASDAWAEKRRVFWKCHPRQCVRCQSTEHLHVHHHTYARLGHEALTDLVAVCASCHDDIHVAYKAARANRERRDLTAVTETILGITLLRVPTRRPGRASSPPPALPHAIPVKGRPGLGSKERAKRATIARKEALLASQGLQRGTKAWNRAMQGGPTEPNEYGFVPRHLRGATRNGTVLVVAPASQRPSWDKRV